MITTTLKAIRKASPCGLRAESDGSLKGYLKLKAFLGEDFKDTAPIKFSVIAESNGLDDALWCLRSLDKEHLPAILAFAADAAESVLHIWEDWAKVNAPEHLEAPRKAIEAARNGLSAAYAAAYAARAAADAARTAAYAAADAARAAADAARAAADAARTAAYAAYAAYAARTAYAARAAADAADAEKEIQLKLLKKHFS